MDERRLTLRFGIATWSGDPGPNARLVLLDACDGTELFNIGPPPGTLYSWGSYTFPIDGGRWILVVEGDPAHAVELEVHQSREISPFDWNLEEWFCP